MIEGAGSETPSFLVSLLDGEQTLQTHLLTPGSRTEALRNLEAGLRPVLVQAATAGRACQFVATDVSSWLTAEILLALHGVPFNVTGTPVVFFRPYDGPTGDDLGEDISPSDGPAGPATEAPTSTPTPPPAAAAPAAPTATPPPTSLSATRTAPFAPTPAAPPAGAVPKLGHLLRDLENASRTGQGDLAGIEKSIREHPDFDSKRAFSIVRAKKQGALARKALEELYKLGRTGDEAAAVRALERFGNEFPYLLPKAEGQVEAGRKCRERKAEQTRKLESGKGLSTVIAHGDHRVVSLKPHPRWSVFVDESGRFPDEGPGASGRLVALLVPDPCPLPEIPGWHATGVTDAEVDSVVQRVLDAECGVLGLALDALPPGPTDRWLTGVLELLSWVLRLMPLDGATKLHVEVEQRSSYTSASDWTAAVVEMKRVLSRLFPRRYANLALEISLVAKSHQKLNGYVDALAFTWGSGSATSRKRLSLSGLLGSCLMSGDACALRDAWDLLKSGEQIPGDQWQRLVADRDVHTPGSISGALLEQVGDACKADPVLWGRLLAATTAHLESKAVRLAEVGAEIDWLSEHQPAPKELLPQLDLAWAIARRERLNHMGEVDAGLDARMATLGDRLFQECPDTVCQADLDRSVLATNAYDWASAERALARWASAPPEVPGLQNWARVQSARGQIAAFRGQLADADRHFGAALDAFAKLSDPGLGRREASQTGTYRAIAAMDDPTVPDASVEALVGAIAPTDAARVAALAASDDSASKYAHHLLLRWIVHRAPSEARLAYLSATSKWKTGFGHPWQLVDTYRAMLLRPTDPEAARARVHEAALAAAEGGPTLRFIALVLRAIAFGWGSRTSLPTSRELSDVRATLPFAPFGPLEQAFARPDSDPLTLMRSCLPFNFR
ncbi:MAG: hypothetical protein QM765_38875 [Myxococcales bacterium]